MNRTEYIAELEARLQSLPEKERRAAINYYEEYFNKAGVQREMNAVDELGTPENAASKILTDFKAAQPAYAHTQHTQPNNKHQKPRRKLFIIPVVLVLFFLCVGAGASTFSVARLNASESPAHASGAAIDFYEEYDNLEELDIEVGVCSIYIIDGERIALEGSNLDDWDFKIDYNDGRLKIKQKERLNFFPFGINNTPVLILTIPSDITLDEADINNGVGTIYIKQLAVDSIDFNVGVGSISIDGLQAQEVDINGGVGMVSVNALSTADLDIKGGVGNTSITDSRVDGKIKLEGGVGKISLDLQNKAEEYEWDVDTGIGGVKLNGSSISKNYKSGASSGAYKIKINSGIGNVTITTK